VALDFPNTPADEAVFDGSPTAKVDWQYTAAKNSWRVIQPQLGTGGFVFLREIPDLSVLPTFIEQELLANTDYEFDIINARSVENNAVLSLQFSADGGVTWEQTPQGEEFATQRVGANSTGERNLVAPDDAPGYGRLGEDQANTYNDNRAPGRHHFHIQTHDLADAQTQATGMFNSYGAFGAPFMQAMFNSRQVAFRVDNRVRIFYAASASQIQERDYLQGLCRIYTRERGA